MAFHGTVGDWRGIKDIVENGFRIRGGAAAPRHGERFGPGVYCSPDPEVAARYAAAQPLPTYDHEMYCVVFQVRVRPGCYSEHWHDDDQCHCWVARDPQDVRPTGILLRQL